MPEDVRIDELPEDIGGTPPPAATPEPEAAATGPAPATPQINEKEIAELYTALAIAALEISMVLFGSSTSEGDEVLKALNRLNKIVSEDKVKMARQFLGQLTMGVMGGGRVA
ncbi:MAG: hypothetical protein QXD29_01835 [Thermoplasmata archaeon]